MQSNNSIGPSEIHHFLGKLSLELDPDLQCISPIVRAGLDLWSQACGARALPARADFDPLTLPPGLLPHILLIDVEHHPRLRFRWRLLGTHITGALGRDSTGCYFDELYEPKIYGAICTGLHWALNNRRPVRSFGNTLVDGPAKVDTESIDMPLSSDGDTIDMIMTVSTYNFNLIQRITGAL